MADADDQTETTADNVDMFYGDLATAKIAELNAQLAAKDALLANRDLQLATLGTDLKNIRERGVTEQKDAAAKATSRFAGDLLNLADNFQRALQAIPADLKQPGSPVSSIFFGLEHLERSLSSIFEKNGIKAIYRQGEIFDPTYDEALSQTQRSDLPVGTVLETLQTGYMLNGRLLRPAAVVISCE